MHTNPSFYSSDHGNKTFVQFGRYVHPFAPVTSPCEDGLNLKFHTTSSDFCERNLGMTEWPTFFFAVRTALKSLYTYSRLTFASNAIM